MLYLVLMLKRIAGVKTEKLNKINCKHGAACFDFTHTKEKKYLKLIH